MVMVCVRVFVGVCMALLFFLCMSGARGADVPLQTAIDGASGGVVTLNPANRYVGNAWIGSSLVIEGGGAVVDLSTGTGWRAISVINQAHVTMRELTIEGGEAGVSCALETTITLNTCVLRNMEQGIVHAGSGGVELIQTQVLDTTSMGMNLAYGSGSVALRMSDSLISGGPFGVMLKSGNAEIIRCRFENLAQGVSHPGPGNLAISDSEFSTVADFALNLGYENGGITARLEDSLFQTGKVGLQLRRGFLTVLRCEFRGFEQGIVALEGLNSEAVPGIIRESRFEDMSAFGIHLSAGGYARIADCTLLRNQAGIFIKTGGHVSVEGCRIDSDSIALPGVGIGLRSGPQAEIRNTEIIGHLNSVDAQTNTGLLVEDCVFRHPLFSGIILLDNSVMTVRRSQFLDNGQDGIYSNDVQWNSTVAIPPCRGAVEECYVDNAGAHPADLSVGITERAGSGIVTVGKGPWRIVGNRVRGSWDVGFVTGSNADIYMQYNESYGNRLGGFIATGTARGLLEDNLFVGSSEGGIQPGAQVGLNSRVALTFRRNLFAGNGYGMIESLISTAHSATLDDNLFVQNINQGLTNNTGMMYCRRNVFLDNGDWQAFARSSAQSLYADGVFTATNKKGLYVERGPCASPYGVPALATGNYWNSAEGAWNGCLGPSPNSRMEYQNCITQPFASSPPVEAWYSGDAVGGTAQTHVSRQSTPWFQCELPARAQRHQVLGAQRPQGDSGVLAPAGVLDSRPIFLWSTLALRGLSGEIRATIQTRRLVGTVSFVRVDPATGNRLESLPVTWNAGEPTVARIAAPASAWTPGVWYFVSPESVSVPRGFLAR